MRKLSYWLEWLTVKNPILLDDEEEVATMHPDFEAEQDYISNAFAVLNRSHLQAKKLHDMVESGKGGTHQARFERDVISDQVNKRLSQLDIGDASLCLVASTKGFKSDRDILYWSYSCLDEQQDPITVDWRAPIAEGFTGLLANILWV